MKAFVSWSGEHSHRIARLLRDWLPEVVPGLELWVSSEDIQLGRRWSGALGAELERASFGLICVDRTNFKAPWLYFEAGALSKSVEEARVIPILVDVDRETLPGPLAQFQCAVWSEDGLRKVVRALHGAVTSSDEGLEGVDGRFADTWPGIAGRAGELRETMIASEESLRTVERGGASAPAEKPTDGETEALQMLAREREREQFSLSTRQVAGRLQRSSLRTESSLRRLLARSFVSRNADGEWVIEDSGSDYLLDNDLL